MKNGTTEGEEARSAAAAQLQQIHSLVINVVLFKRLRDKNLLIIGKRCDFVCAAGSIMVSLIYKHLPPLINHSHVAVIS